jgi:hypothetical protein
MRKISVHKCPECEYWFDSYRSDAVCCSHRCRMRRMRRLRREARALPSKSPVIP